MGASNICSPHGCFSCCASKPQAPKHFSLGWISPQSLKHLNLIWFNLISPQTLKQLYQIWFNLISPRSLKHWPSNCLPGLSPYVERAMNDDFCSSWKKVLGVSHYEEAQTEYWAVAAQVGLNIQNTEILVFVATRIVLQKNKSVAFSEYQLQCCKPKKIDLFIEGVKSFHLGYKARNICDLSSK